jgi:hypothetical protein
MRGDRILSGAKAPLLFKPSTARLKSCPDTCRQPTQQCKLRGRREI